MNDRVCREVSFFGPPVQGSSRCMNEKFDQCVGHWTVFRPEGREWRMHSCFADPTYTEFPKGWEICPSLV